MGLEITSLRIGPEKNFCYLVYCADTFECAIFDGAFDFDKIKKAVNQISKVKVKYLVATHGHWDHAGGLGELKKTFPNAHVVVGKKDSDMIKKFGATADILLEDGDELVLGENILSVLSTPGHTPGGCCFLNEGILLTGDTLFINQCGRTDLEGGSDSELFESLQKLKELPSKLVVYPGHDYGPTPNAPLGEQKRTNPTLRAKNLREFKQCP